MPRSAKIESWNLKPPRQARSLATLHRIIGATEGLLAESAFHDIPVSEIVRRAGSSVGAFYARFRDKDTLLDHLEQAFREEMEGAARVYAEDPHWREASVGELIGEIVRYFVEFHRQRRGLLRTLIQRRQVAEPLDIDRGTNPLAAVLARRVMDHRREIDHPNPELAVHLGLAMVMHTIRERILFPDTFESGVPVSEGVLKQELTRAYLGYLDIPMKGKA